jgi:hypothetical protein
MIPDHANIFNAHDVPKNFDDHETRLRYRLGQDAMFTLEGGRHLLYRCPVCQHPWYKAGRRAYPRLTGEELSHLGTALQADIHAHHLLPQALCPICSTIYLDGLFTIDEYYPQRGFHFLWEHASPPRTMLVAMIWRARGQRHDLNTMVRSVPDTLISPMSMVQSVLDWLETCPFPSSYQRYSEQERRLLAHRLPCDALLTQQPLMWRGYSWMDVCLPLGGSVLVSLAVAVQPCECTPFPQLLTAWRMLARTMRTVL